MTGETLSRVLIADDHPLFRSALLEVVGEAMGRCACAEAQDWPRARELLRGADFDLILLDLHMPGMNGFTGLIALRNLAPATPIVVVSAESAAATMQDAIAFGASGFIPKSLPKEGMTGALRRVLAGEVFLPADHGAVPPERGRGAAAGEGLAALTQQQRCVVEMMVTGKSNKVIAHELSIAESTVKAHVSAILRKLRVSNRTQAVINAAKLLGEARHKM
mgnify:CR=1 FL=1